MKFKLNAICFVAKFSQTYHKVGKEASVAMPHWFDLSLAIMM